jgi:ATP-dependent 26S proteasome regulatory subunit
VTTAVQPRPDLQSIPTPGGELERDLAWVRRRLLAHVEGQQPDDGDATVEIAAPLLRRCAQIFNLRPHETQALVMALSVELDEALVDMFARAQTGHQRRPTVGLLVELLRHDLGAREIRASLGPGGHLARSGLVEVVGDGAQPDRIVRVPDSFWPRLDGAPLTGPYASMPRVTGGLDALVLSETTRAQVAQAIAGPRRALGHQGILWIRGPAGSGRHWLGAALAGELGFGTLTIDVALADDAAHTPHLARETAWAFAALVISGVPSARTIERLAAEISTPMVIIDADTTHAPIAELPGRWTAEIVVGPLDVDGREQVWRCHLREVALSHGVELRSLAARSVAGPGRIAAMAAMIRRAAETESRAVRATDVREVLRTGRRSSGLAQRLEARIALDELVVPPLTRRELELAIAWARRGPSVFHREGGGRLLRGFVGLTCLFFGPPGTGKTMAAHVVATSIDADILRVDLSQVVDKYIGETEKNLARVFDDAEESGAVLFFDEADALFGKRTETKTAHDRYANLETAFLLQRLEQHRGICILATNLRHNVDEAYSRRIQIVAEFPLPGREDRRRLWQRQLPADVLAGDVDLDALADRAKIAGGDIRNAAATAAVLAAGEASSITMRHLVIGTWRELKKAGRLVSAEDFGPWKDAVLSYARDAGVVS